RYSTGIAALALCTVAAPTTDSISATSSRLHRTLARRPMPAVAASSGRRSNPEIGPLLEELLIHPFGYRRRCGGPVAAMLDEDDDHELRVLHRREADEPGVVAGFDGQVLGSSPDVLGDHLRGAGLAADRQPRYEGGVAGAGVDDRL